MAENKKVVLFGVGKNIEDVKRYIKLNENEELRFCDNDIAKQGKEFEDSLVVSADSVFEWNHNNLIEKVIITSRAIKPIFNQCILGRIHEDKIFYWDYDNCIARKGIEWFGDITFSQDAEDIYLQILFANKEKGFYVDIGANHPLHYSNTRWAYQKGWRGINIEPDEKCYELLNCMRTRDINLQVGISQVNEDKDFYLFQESALNTFDKQEAESVVARKVYGNYEITKRQCRRLETVFNEYQIQKIDFMDIDVEGMEMAVLQSINWDVVEINVILVEQKNMSIEDVMSSEIYRFLKEKGYTVINKYRRTVFYEKWR